MLHWRHALRPLPLLLFSLVGCTRAGFIDWPCRGVTCSGHGRCKVADDSSATCACDPGYRPGADLQCLPTLGPLPDGGVALDAEPDDAAAGADAVRVDAGAGDGTAATGDGAARDGAPVDVLAADAIVAPDAGSTDAATPVVTLSFVADALVVDEVGGPREVPWAPGLEAWSHRLCLELGNAFLAEDLLDFPLLVTLDPARLPTDLVETDGRDLRVTDAAGSLLAFEVATWDPAGTSRLWVRVPRVPADPAPGAIYLYTGNPAATPAADGSAVWTPPHALVYHLDETAGGVDAVRDATANGHHASTVADVRFGEPSPLGRGISAPNDSSPGSSAYLAVSSSAQHLPLAGASFTLLAQARVDDMVDGVIFSAFEQSAAGRDLELGVRRLSPFVRYFGDSLEPPEATLLPATWHSLAFVYDAAADESRIYVDGAAVATSSAGPYQGLTSTLRVGYRGGTTGYFFKGGLDEIRLATTARSADWVRAEHLSQRDQLLRYRPLEARTALAAPTPVAITLSQPLGSDLDVTVVTAGAAVDGVDYALAASTVTIAAGQTQAALLLTALRDGITEGDEEFVLSLVVPAALQVGAHPSCTVTLRDETPVTPRAEADDLSLASPGAAALDVLANDPGVDAAVWRIAAVGAPAHGTVENLGRLLVYLPDEDHPGTDVFEYTVSDGATAVGGTVAVTLATPFTWVGGGGDARWANPANWMGGAVPTASSQVVFNALCASTCDAVIDAAAQAYAVRLASAFQGTLTQSGSATLTVGTGGWSQRGGTFAGGSGAITVSRFELLGGSFVSTSGTLGVRQEGYRARVDSDLIVRGGSFDANGGAVAIWGANAYSRLYLAHVDVGSTPLNHLTLSGQGVYFELAGTTTVRGNLTLNAQSCGGCNFETLSGGVLEVHGDVVNDSYNLGFGGNTTVVRLVGTGPHNLRGPPAPNSGSCVPVIELDTTGDVGIQGYHYLRGGLIVRRAGVVTTTDSILRFCGSASIQSSGVVLDDVQLDCSNTVYTLLDPLTVAGTLTINDGSTGGQINGASILALGDVALVGRSKLGNTLLTLGGTAPASLSIASSVVDRVPGPVLTIDKPAGVVVSLSGAPLNLGQPGQGLALLGGTLALNGLDLVIDGEFQFPVGAEVATGGASLSYGSITPPLGSGGTLRP